MNISKIKERMKISSNSFNIPRKTDKFGNTSIIFRIVRSYQFKLLGSGLLSEGIAPRVDSDGGVTEKAGSEEPAGGGGAEK